MPPKRTFVFLGAESDHARAASHRRRRRCCCLLFPALASRALSSGRGQRLLIEL